MNRILSLFVFFATLNWSAPIWDFSEDLQLKKDEMYKRDFSINGIPKHFYFYWTLYKNYGLVINLNYDKFPYQFILYRDYKRKSFRIPVSSGDDTGSDGYLVLIFKDFDEQNKRANLKLLMMLPKHLFTKKE